MGTADEHALLQAGDLLSPFVHGTTLHGRAIPYEQLWQHRNVVLFVLADHTAEGVREYISAVNDQLSELEPQDTTLLISHESSSGLPMNSLVIADRWGEIAEARRLESDPAQWPPVSEIIAWVEFVRAQCPECPP
jgi:hypothetical protein